MRAGVVGNQIIEDLNETFGFARQPMPDAPLLATASLLRTPRG
jgi:hypothetical protein